MYKNVHLSPEFSINQVSSGLLFTIEGEQTLIAGEVKVVALIGTYGVAFEWNGQVYKAYNAGGVLDINREISCAEDYPF